MTWIYIYIFRMKYAYFFLVVLIWSLLLYSCEAFFWHILRVSFPWTITVTSQWPLCRLKSHLFLISKKTPNPALLALCEGNPSVTGGFPSQTASNAGNVSMEWRHHVYVEINWLKNITKRTKHSQISHDVSYEFKNEEVSNVIKSE